MKISIPFFRGEVPRQSSRLLPDGYASSATNARLLSGDLTSWKESTAHAQSPLLPSAILKAIYKSFGVITNTSSDYDGTNDYTTRGADLTGISDGKQGIFSCWARFDGGNSLTQYILSSSTTLAGSTTRFEVFKFTDNKIYFIMKNAAGTNILNINTTATYTASSTWLHILASWDLNVGGARHIYINDVSDITQTTFTNDTIDYTVADWAVGALPDGTSKLNSALQQLFFNTTYVDLSVTANRRKYISSFLEQTPFGSVGQLPLGNIKPLIFAEDGDVTGNVGSGGTFTLVGTLDKTTSAPTSITTNDIFYRSQDDVNWAKGAVAGDSLERLYFTSYRDDPSLSLSAPARPKVTNIRKALGGKLHSGQTIENYPNDWLLIGVPSPVTPPAGTSTPISTGSPTIWSDGTSLTPWVDDLGGTTNLTANDATMGGLCIKMTDQANMHASSDPGGPNDSGEGMSFDFRISGAEKYFEVRFACSSTGNGPIFRLKTGKRVTVVEPPLTEYEQTAGNISIGTATSWIASPSFTSSNDVGAGGTSPIGFSDIGDTLLTNTNTTCNLTVSVSGSITSILIQIGSYFTKTYTFTSVGNYFGFRTDPVNTGVNSFVDNVSLSTNVPTTDARTTSYVYTWINELGEEGPPSPASPLLTISSGFTTVISNITDPSSTDQIDYGLNNFELGTKRLYRASTGAEGQTDFLFVTDVDYGITTHTDITTETALGEVLESTDWIIPPADAHSVLSLPNGITVMASKNDVCPSVQNRPHAYPDDFKLSTDYDIVGLGAIDTTVVVLTKANPYIVVGSDSSQLSMAKLELPYGCSSKRSIASLKGFGIIYASPDGLVSINGTGVNLISDQFFTREQWQALVPTSIFGFVHDDRYFFFYDTGVTKAGYIFDPKDDGNGLTKLDLSVHTGLTINNAVTAAYSSPLTDTLYYIHTDNKLTIWNSHASTGLQYNWRSKVYKTFYPFTPQAAQLKSRSFGLGVTLKTYVDNVLHINQSVNSNREFVLPSIASSEGANEYEAELIGTVTIESIEIAETMEELS